MNNPLDFIQWDWGSRHPEPADPSLISNFVERKTDSPGSTLQNRKPPRSDDDEFSFGANGRLIWFCYVTARARYWRNETEMLRKGPGVIGTSWWLHRKPAMTDAQTWALEERIIQTGLARQLVVFSTMYHDTVFLSDFGQPTSELYLLSGHPASKRRVITTTFLSSRFLPDDKKYLDTRMKIFKSFCQVMLPDLIEWSLRPLAGLSREEKIARLTSTPMYKIHDDPLTTISEQLSVFMLVCQFCGLPELVSGAPQWEFVLDEFFRDEKIDLKRLNMDVISHRFDLE